MARFVSVAHAAMKQMRIKHAVMRNERPILCLSVARPLHRLPRMQHTNDLIVEWLRLVTEVVKRKMHTCDKHGAIKKGKKQSRLTSNGVGLKLHQWWKICTHGHWLELAASPRPAPSHDAHWGWAIIPPCQTAPLQLSFVYPMNNT